MSNIITLCVNNSAVMHVIFYCDIIVAIAVI